MINLNNANNIKGLLIDFLIKENVGFEYLLGSEIYFGTKKRKADILFVNGSVTGYEIKSENDDFRRTREQLNDYKKVFDYQVLVTTRNHEQNAKSIITLKEGLIIIQEDGAIKTIKEPQIIKNQDKTEILETIPISFLKKHFRLSSKLKSAKVVRKHLFDYSKVELMNGLRIFLETRLRERNNAFLSEKGESTHYEDIWLLKTDFDHID